MDYERQMRSRIRKNLDIFQREELPLLVERGFTEPKGTVTTCCHANDAADSINWHSLNEISGLRGSPSLAGRGIANPMSERTRGFELSARFR